MLEIGSPLREPLFLFVTRHPDAAIQIFFQDRHMSNAHFHRMLVLKI